MLPLLLDFRGRTALVVGGGPVGSAKARTLAAAGASVTVLAPEAPVTPLDSIGCRIGAFQEADVVGFDLVVAAAPPEVNRRVVVAARARQIWVVSCSDPGAGDVAFPAVWSDPPLTVAVSTGGASPALARELRDHLRGSLPPGWLEWLRELHRLRPIILERVADPERRRALLRRLGTFDAAALGPEGVEGLIASYGDGPDAAGARVGQ